MNERLQRYLDKEVRQEDLSPAELQELQTYNAIIAETQAAHRSIKIPDLTASVMAQLPAEPLPGSADNFLTRTVRWLWEPHVIRLRPAYGVAGTLVVLAIAVIIGVASLNNPAAPAAGKVFVQFRLDAPQASTVRLAGSFTQWAPQYNLQQVSPGIWSVLIPLDPGVYSYAFVVNGREWIADPAAPAVADGFGGVNSRLSLLMPSSTSEL